MAEEKIIVTIKEDGELAAESFGIEGPVCMDTLGKLLEGLGSEKKRSPKDEYYQQAKHGTVLTRRVGQ